MGSSYRPDNGGDSGIDDAVVAEINITPLTDVFLVLLIIFMVTTSVVANQSKNIDLPGAEVSDTTPQGVTVTVEENGVILINDKPVSNDALFTELEAALSEAREKLVILRGDKKVLLGQAVNILDVAQQAGAKGIALATKPPPKQG
jgi:biopolymer transport protein ExbD